MRQARRWRSPSNARWPVRDAVADRRAEEFTRLATAAELQVSIARHEAALAGSTVRAERCRLAVHGAEAEWAVALAPAGLTPGATLAELRAFLAARDKVVAALQAGRIAADAADALAKRHAASATAIAAAMQTTPDTLPRLLNAAKARIAVAERAVAQRQASTRALVTARRATTLAATKLDGADIAMRAWTTQWTDALARLRRPGGEPPAATAAVLDRLVALPAQVAAADIAQGRLNAMTAQLGQFADRCRAIAARLGEPDAEPEILARRLGARLTASRKVDAQRGTLRMQDAAARERHRRAADTLARAQAALRAAIAAAGGETLEQAERCVALAAERLAQQQAHADALARLWEDGDGRDPATLRAETAATPPEAAAEAKLAAESEEAAAQQEAQDAAAQQERAEGELRRLAAGQDAARAATDRQAAAARMSRVLDEALVQHLAAAMLEHGLQEVEAIGSANHRLERISRTFDRLTHGTYTRLTPGGDGKDSDSFGRIVAHEAGGAEKHIAELSEGTRDQLYLALRLVAVEDHVQNAPPLPFVADDILQTSDDRRARAAMEALVGLSHHVQVILLTHHPHLIEVGKGLPIHEPRMVALG